MINNPIILKFPDLGYIIALNKSNCGFMLKIVL